MINSSTHYYYQYAVECRCWCSSNTVFVHWLQILNEPSLMLSDLKGLTWNLFMAKRRKSFQFTHSRQIAVKPNVMKTKLNDSFGFICVIIDSFISVFINKCFWFENRKKKNWWFVIKQQALFYVAQQWKNIWCFSKSDEGKWFECGSILCFIKLRNNLWVSNPRPELNVIVMSRFSHILFRFDEVDIFLQWLQALQKGNSNPPPNIWFRKFCYFLSFW